MNVLGKKNHVELITGLDIGSTAVRIAVGKLSFLPNKSTELQIISTVEVQSDGVQKGVINSIEEAVSSVSHALEKTERIVGVPIEHAWVGISGSHISSQESRGVVAVAKTNGEIGPEDVSRAVEAARTVATPLNYEILHVLPRSYIVDGQTGIKDPVGMTGIRLEVDTQIIQGLTSHIKNLTKTVYRTGIDIDDLVLSILASGEVIVTPKQKDLGVAVVNIGGATTSIVVYEEGDIIHTAVLPIGSIHITNDLAIGLRSSIEIAEKVKIEFGECVDRNLNKKDFIDLAAVGSATSEPVAKKKIVEYIGARLEEILEKVDAELIKAGRSHLLPAGVIFTGGGAKISGLVELAKNVLGLPASLGFPNGIMGISDKINDPSFSTAIGLVRWGAQIKEGGTKKSLSLVKNVDKVASRVKNLFKTLIP